MEVNSSLYFKIYIGKAVNVMKVTLITPVSFGGCLERQNICLKKKQMITFEREYEDAAGTKSDEKVGSFAWHVT